MLSSNVAIPSIPVVEAESSETWVEAGAQTHAPPYLLSPRDVQSNHDKGVFFTHKIDKQCTGLIHINSMHT